jgi:hypothetical protein
LRGLAPTVRSGTICLGTGTMAAALRAVRKVKVRVRGRGKRKRRGRRCMGKTEKEETAGGRNPEALKRAERKDRVREEKLQKEETGITTVRVSGRRTIPPSGG